jgi:hypothetical protein
MGQPFRLLVTDSRTWHDIPAIEQALAVILDRIPRASCWCTAHVPAEPTPSPPPTTPGPPATGSRRTPQTGTGTGELPDTAATRA